MTSLQVYIDQNIEKLFNDLESEHSVNLLMGIKSSLSDATDWMNCRDLKGNFSPKIEFDRVCMVFNTVQSILTSGSCTIATSRDHDMITSFCDIRNLPTS